MIPDYVLADLALARRTTIAAEVQGCRLARQARSHRPTGPSRPTRFSLRRTRVAGAEASA